jgi:hypothetical protein
VYASGSGNANLDQVDIVMNEDGVGLLCNGCQLAISNSRITKLSSSDLAIAVQTHNGAAIASYNNEFRVSGGHSNIRVIELNNSDFHDRHSTVYAGEATTHSYGIYVQGDEANQVSLNGSTITADHPSSANNTAIFAFQVNLDLRESAVQALSSPGDNAAVRLNRSTLQMHNSQALGTDYGIRATSTSGGPFPIDVHHSTLSGETSSISHDMTFTSQVMFSELNGGSAHELVSCRFVVDGDFIHYLDSCP